MRQFFRIVRVRGSDEEFARDELNSDQTGTFAPPFGVGLWLTYDWSLAKPSSSSSQLGSMLTDVLASDSFDWAASSQVPSGEPEFSFQSKSAASWLVAVGADSSMAGV